MSILKITTNIHFAQYGERTSIEHGNITQYINHGSSPMDAYRTVLSYDDPNFKGLPTALRVYKNTDGSNPLRQRESDYTDQGKLSAVITHLDANNTNTVQLKYDQYGNTTEVNHMDNLGADGNTHFATQIEYDGVLHTYPIRIEDSYGQVSESVYDYLFGIPVLRTDPNSNSMRTRIDNRGRPIEVTGPKEYVPLNMLGESPWTIRNEYPGEIPVAQQTFSSPFNKYLYSNAQGAFEARSDFQSPDPTNAQHHAMTRHRDGLINGNEFLTLSIVDGFGRAIQLKKTHFMDGSRLVWQVSGKEKTDSIGRVEEIRLPTIDTNYPNNVLYDNRANTIPPQQIVYDIRDRQTKITQPGEGAGTTFGYSIESDRFVTRITNELGQTQETHTDIRGRQRKVVQNNEITTEFFYNALNEQIKVRNNAGYETHYSYDMAGRRTQEQHPDRGTTHYTYDNASRLVEKQTANLMQQGNTGAITYLYDFGHLVKVTYPNHPENNVAYTFGQNTPSNIQINAVGRLLLQADATGIQQFEYGKMGELTRQVRAMAVAGKMSYWFDTQWEYDSWNRIGKITYPDKEEVTYSYDPAGQLKAVNTNLANFVPGANPIIVKSITYTDLGERSSMEYGNGTVTNYDYDVRRRMDLLEHSFSGFQAARTYKYDEVSNILGITTVNTTSPALGQLGGPVSHVYTYDDYNRLETATGHYVGPDDAAPDMLKQAYSLTMAYDDAHNILEKHQVHQFGSVGAIGDNLPQDAAHAPLTSYKLEYGDYATGEHSDDFQNYVQPHAPRTIIEYPNEDYSGDPDDPRIKHKLIDYDADGNQLEIRERIADPGESGGYREVPLKKHLWDEEDRLKAVDLNPESDTDKPLVAAYTYDASGERSIKYVPGRLDARYSAKEAGKAERLEATLYPNPLVTVKTLKEDEYRPNEKKILVSKYTKHYYIGSERISSALGTINELGLFCETPSRPLLTVMNGKLETAGAALIADYASFGKQLVLTAPYWYNNQIGNCPYAHNDDDYAAFWYHPDHLGSSSYITNLAGEITQHMEYLPFGETLVEEHLNSNNSPYKFNAKEMDAETGNYYMSARYYDPKWSIWLSVDPLAEQTFESYSYVGNNPIMFIDPTGMSKESTHIDNNGNVVAVFNDRDKGVYQHGKNADGSSVTEYDLSKRQEAQGTSAGGTKIGETEHLDEFVSPETGKAMTNYRIQVGKSFDPIIQKLAKQAEGMGLIGIANESGDKGDFDMKIPYANVGALLNGKYATSRSAGNYLAGYNANNGVISYNTFQKLAGALHYKNSRREALTTSDKINIVLTGKSYGPAPAYGENMYQHRMSAQGWSDKGKSGGKININSHIMTGQKW